MGGSYSAGAKSKRPIQFDTVRMYENGNTRREMGAYEIMISDEMQQLGQGALGILLGRCDCNRPGR